MTLAAECNAKRLAKWTKFKFFLSMKIRVLKFLYWLVPHASNTSSVNCMSFSLRNSVFLICVSAVQENARHTRANHTVRIILRLDSKTCCKNFLTSVRFMISCEKPKFIFFLLIWKIKSRWQIKANQLFFFGLCEIQREKWHGIRFYWLSQERSFHSRLLFCFIAVPLPVLWFVWNLSKYFH